MRSTVKRSLLSVADTEAKIGEGRPLLLAGDEELLKQLPRGTWIAGTIPYFMTESGGATARDQIFVTELPEAVTGVKLRVYDEQSIREIYGDIPENGFSVVILPAGTKIHEAFATDAPTYDRFATRPLVGWVSGVHLSDVGKVSAKVYADGQAYGDRAVVLHVGLPAGKAAEVGIVNIFTQSQRDTITFPVTGFKVTDAWVNGELRNFAEYVKAKALDSKLPLVADYHGSSINVSFQSVDIDKREVTFYAPVFAGIAYKHAADVTDYVSEFTAQMPEHADGIAFACNCILNYMYSNLEGKQTGGITGPITFGEIAYQLLNQTLVYVTVVDIPAVA
jgi:hypothetical protein